jgi:hypothetical protein
MKDDKKHISGCPKPVKKGVLNIKKRVYKKSLGNKRNAVFQY